MRVLALLLAALIIACGRFGSPIAPGVAPSRNGLVYEILEVEQGRELSIRTPLGPLRVDWGVGMQEGGAAPPELERMLEHVREGGVDLGRLALYRTALAGPYLYSPELVVLPEGILVASDPDALRARAEDAHARARVALRAAIESVVTSLERRERDPSALAALVQILNQLDRERNPRASLDTLPPSFARRLVRYGWLATLDVDAAARAGLEAAVREAESLRPVTRFASARSRLVYSEDAFDEGVWLLQTPERSGYSRLSERPAYYGARHTITVVHLPTGADPETPSESWRAAELYSGDVRLAGWDPEQGFRVDEHAWRDVFGPPPGQFELSGALPPHILVERVDGDVLALVTAFGRLEPARDGSAGEVARFFSEAAKALPDAAHLDLIGEYLVVYVYDSPDPRRPWLVGTLDQSGDIHQTASQTLATQTGGTYRGDCDDLSELYQGIAERQGKNAHLIGLPAHAALVWAEHGADDSWRTYLLQTGRPLEFDGDTLEASLQELYDFFGAGEVLDLTRLEVLLRFSGENTRSTWFLSSRIFTDPSYARVMIDVQRDWHFQTYQRAIHKMTRLIDSGDRDPANLAELAGLYRFTGQYAESAEALRAADELLTSPETRLSIAVDRVEVLYAAGRAAEARAQALEILQQRIPRLEAQLGEPLLDPRLALADVLLIDANDPALGLDVLARLTPRVDELTSVLALQVESEGFDPNRWREGRDGQVRYQLRRFAGSAIAALRTAAGTPLEGGDAWKRVNASLAEWFARIAFLDIEGPETVVRRYGLLGRYLEAILGAEAFRERVAASPPPETRERDHADRSVTASPSEADIAWVSIATSFWAGAQRDLFAFERTSVDPDQVLALAARVARARDRALALGISHPSFDEDVRTSELVAAIAARDHARLRRVFHELYLANDRQQLWETASWLAAVARFLPLSEYAALVDVWRRELNTKPMYFWIAWNAVLAGASEHALHVAELAASEFADDAAFVEEYEFMRSLPDLSARARSRPGA